MNKKILYSDSFVRQKKANFIAFTEQCLAQKKRLPKLAIIQVGNDFSSAKYIQNKLKFCGSVNILTQLVVLPASIKKEQLVQEVKHLNQDSTVDGIIVQLPLPEHLDPNLVISNIATAKDVDGFTSEWLGRLQSYNWSPIVPATPKGIMQLLQWKKISLQGKLVIVINQSNIVGKPLVNMLMNKQATIISCNEYTPDLDRLIKQADIVVSATGKKNLIKNKALKTGACVIDVGFSRHNNKIYGDIEICEPLLKKVQWVTPVPKGVGPITITALIDNLLYLYQLHQT